jgi:hypothetical protein
MCQSILEIAHSDHFVAFGLKTDSVLRMLTSSSIIRIFNDWLIVWVIDD